MCVSLSLSNMCRVAPLLRISLIRARISFISNPAKKIRQSDKYKSLSSSWESAASQLTESIFSFFDGKHVATLHSLLNTVLSETAGHVVWEKVSPTVAGTVDTTVWDVGLALSWLEFLFNAFFKKVLDGIEVHWTGKRSSSRQAVNKRGYYKTIHNLLCTRIDIEYRQKASWQMNPNVTSSRNTLLHPFWCHNANVAPLPGNYIFITFGSVW